MVSGGGGGCVVWLQALEERGDDYGVLVLEDKGDGDYWCLEKEKG